MNAPKRSRARVLTPEGLQKLRERVRSHEVEENAGFKYTLERLGELTGLDPETVKNVLDCKGSDKRTIARCFESFGLTLVESDHIPAAQATTTADPNFVGRDEAIADLNTLVSRNARVIVIQARGGVGKTTLARKYLQQEFGSFLEFPIAKETKDIASIQGLLEEKLRQLGEEPGREFLVSLDRLKRKLQAERIGILIDNLEPALDSAGKFIEAHRRYVELLRVLSDPIVQSLTLITSRERLREADVTVQHYSLRSLDVQAWSQFFQSRSINTETRVLTALHNAYGGNAKAMDIISGTVLEDFSGDIEAYWQANQDDLFIERDLEDLVTKQFDRLQQLDLDAYKLLCRMGCCRYQDVPTVPIEGLFCLLWDVPNNRHRRVIKSLQDRSLIDFDGEYWLHPIIRLEALSRLREDRDWDAANQRFADFWTKSVEVIETIEDALKAFEAYSHYTQINSLEKACIVILTKRKWRNQEEEILLGVSFYRLGLFQPMISAITFLIDRIELEHEKLTLQNILGNLYFHKGNIRKSIENHNSSGETALKLGLKKMRIHALINLGYCKIGLWEIQEAIEHFEQIVALTENNENLCYAVYSYSHLAFLYFCLGYKQDALNFANKAYVEFSTNHFGEFVEAYELYFLGLTFKRLNEFDKSTEIYDLANSYAEAICSSQAKGVVVSGIAELCREEQDFERAINLYLEAIDFLQKVDAIYDLAEVHYQLGLTYQDMGEFEKSDLKFQEAICLFSEMEAPKQVERVRQSMQSSQ